MATDGDNTRVIAGRYRLEERLGRGGMGVVWRATDQLLGRGVAVKELPLDEALSAEDARRQRDRTLREARAVAQLRHPHIIVVHDVVVDDTDDERPYIVMELIDGGSLADRLATHGPVDAAEAARIGIALLGALRHAHSAGVLHRDLKPANVLLEDGTDRVVLTDFGIAQVAGATTLTESGSFVGSPEYTAPERMSGARTGPESDLWSLGALLCAALSGASPFHRDSLGGVLHAVVSAEIRPPAQAGPLLPVVRGLLERDPERRLDTEAAERMLRAFLDTGRTPQTPPLGYLPPQREMLGRGPSTRQDRADRGSSALHDLPGRGRPAPQQRMSAWRSPALSLAAPPAGESAVRRPTRGVLVSALLVVAMAGAGVSAAALLLDGDGGGGGTPTSPAPKTPPTGSRSSNSPSTSAPSPRTPSSAASSPVASSSDSPSGVPALRTHANRR